MLADIRLIALCHFRDKKVRGPEANVHRTHKIEKNLSGKTLTPDRDGLASTQEGTIDRHILFFQHVHN